LFNLILIIVVSTICASGNSDRIRGNGNTVTLDKTTPDFGKIQLITTYSNNNDFDGKV
jgi:hypothetical protein